MNQKHTNRMREHFEESREAEPITSRCMHAAEDTIRENPVVATLALFGIGMGIGVFLGRSIAQSDRFRPAAKPRMQRWLDSMSGALPESIRRQMAH
jgi:hypothetical protein